MVAQQQRVYPSDSDSESLCDTEEPETTDTSSNQGYLPILSHYKHQATAVSHEEQDNASPPIPPLRTASMRVGATRVQFQVTDCLLLRRESFQESKSVMKLAMS